MKKWARGLVVCAAAAVLSIGAACMAYAAEGEINVNGTGVVQADPDTADISLEISTDGKAAQAAQKENNRITAAVTKAMTDLNVKKDDIVTAYTSVYPTYRYNDETGKRTITGYHAETHLQVKTKDINNTGKYIDAALQARRNRHKRRFLLPRRPEQILRAGIAGSCEKCRKIRSRNRTGIRQASGCREKCQRDFQKLLLYEYRFQCKEQHDGNRGCCGRRRSRHNHQLRQN